MSFASLQTMAPAGFARRWVMHGLRWVMTLTWAACAFMSVAQAAPKTAAVRAWITTTDQVHLLASAPAQALVKGPRLIWISRLMLNSASKPWWALAPTLPTLRHG